MEDRPRISLITAEYLRSRLHYNPDTGVWTWLSMNEDEIWKKAWNTRWAGVRAGYIVRGKYRSVAVDAVCYREHRLAWLYMTGKWPVDQIDHINCNGLDGRWVNLREADNTQNCRNTRRGKNNSSGYKGVSFESWTGRWRAGIMVNRKHYNLGRYDTPEEAHVAYAKAAAKLHGEFARTV